MVHKAPSMSAQPDTQPIPESLQSEREKVTFTLQGVPPSVANQRLHWSKKASQSSEWYEKAYYMAFSARVMAGRYMAMVPRAQFNPGRRLVEITLYRRRLLDTDNAYSSIKAILDGLKGQLIVDDSPQWIELKVSQVKIKAPESERTQITVWREQ